MAKISNGERSLNTLEKDIRRLQARAKTLEDEIDNNFTYLQQHSAALFINSLFPGKRRETGTDPGGLLQGFLQNERIQRSLNRLLTRMTEKASSFINRLIDKWID